MKKSLLLAATAALVIGAGPALAKKQLVIVVKGLDNPFFESIHQGCEKWNSENKSSEYECFYTGPASTSDEAGEAQILQDILSKPDTAAVAISLSRLADFGSASHCIAKSSSGNTDPSLEGRSRTWP